MSDMIEHQLYLMKGKILGDIAKKLGDGVRDQVQEIWELVEADFQEVFERGFHEFTRVNKRSADGG